MECMAPATRSDAQTVFRLLRRLMQGCCVWGPHAALRLSDLVSAGPASRHQVLRAIVHMRRQGLISVEQPVGVVRLTPQALEQLTGSAG
jgi:hypothetical protein